MKNQKKIMDNLIVSLLDDREGFSEFATEARAIISELTAHLELTEKEIDIDYLFRSLHTVKAGFFSFQILDIAELIHQLEDDVIRLKGEKRLELVNSLPVLRKSAFEIKVNFEKILKQYRLAFGNFVVRDGIEGAVDDMLFLDDLALSFKQYEKTVLELAEKQKKEVDLIIKPSNVYVRPGKYKRFIATTIHLFRNAIDHGIEDMKTREMCGKEAKAVISVICTKVENKIKLSISDDGQGIDASTIGRLAVEKKICSQADIDKMTEDEIVQLIFTAGFSTKTEITSLSGRGVGLDSVKSEVESFGGSVLVITKLGEGSEFVITLPV